MKSCVLGLAMLSLIAVPASAQYRGKSFQNQASGARSTHRSTNTGWERRRDEANRDWQRDHGRKNRDSGSSEGKSAEYDFDLMRTKMLLDSANGKPLKIRRKKKPVVKKVAVVRPPQFNSAEAMDPEEFVKQFIKNGKQAENFEQISSYLPDASIESVKEEQVEFEAVESEAQESPHQRELAKYKSLAANIIEVGDAKKSGTRADMLVTVQVEPENGEDRYKVAKLSLRGEGKTWRISSYLEIEPSYDVPPPPF